MYLIIHVGSRGCRCILAGLLIADSRPARDNKTPCVFTFNFQQALEVCCDSWMKGQLGHHFIGLFEHGVASAHMST